MECNLVWNHMSDFKIERAHSASSIWNHKYDFRPKLHSTQFNCHFIRSILKSHDSIALNFRFLVPVTSLLKKVEPETLYISFSMQNDVMWRKLIRAWQRNKQFWNQNENSPLQVQKFSSRRLNQWWKAFLSFVVEAETFIVFGEGIWRCILSNSAIDFFWVVKLPRVHDAQWIVRFFSFKHCLMAWF